MPRETLWYDKETAELLGWSVPTLRARCWKGYGPPYQTAFGRRVYSPAQVRAWKKRYLDDVARHKRRITDIRRDAATLMREERKRKSRREERLRSYWQTKKLRGAA